MNTIQVETFECHETAHEPIEISEEAQRLIDKLALTGQRSYLVKDDDDKTKSRCPYRLMTAEEDAVYKTLCPEAVELEKYDAAPIPLRVLQIAAHASEVIPGVRIKVWDKAKHQIKDPVLVGEVGQYDWRPDKRFILARWGAELDTFATLLQMACKTIRERVVAEAKNFAGEFQNASDAKLLKNFALVMPNVTD